MLWRAVVAEGGGFDLNEMKIEGQLSHLHSACVNLSSYDLRDKVGIICIYMHTYVYIILMLK